MRYLVTDNENKSWRGETWGENVSHKETNSNYFFWTYEHPDVAALMVPVECRNLQNPRLWQCECVDLSDVDYGTISHDWGYRRRYPYVKTLQEEIFFQPTDEQRIAFAMLVTLSVSENPLVTAWIRNWLLDLDRTPETAQRVSEALTDEMWQNYDTYAKYYTNSAYALTCSIAQPDQTAQYSAGSAYRAYVDSQECPNCGADTANLLCLNTDCPYSAPSAQGLVYEPVNLQKYAEIVKACNIKEIADVVID